MPGRDALGRGRMTPIVPGVGVIALVYHDWAMEWTTPHHVLTRLARYFPVVWVNPAPGWREVLAGLGTRREGRISTSQYPGFAVYTPEPWLPRFYRPAWLVRFTFKERLRQARRLLISQGCNRTILYLWHYQFGSSLRSRSFDLSCYHIDDEYSFSSVECPLDEHEVAVISGVDQVFITSPGLLERKGGINPHTELVPQGVEYRDYSTVKPEPSDLAPVPHPRIGYTGWLKKQLDWRLLRELVERRPTWSFVFVGGQLPHPEIGPVISELSGHRNVWFLGQKSSAEMSAYPQHFDVCVMPYLSDGYTKYIYPLKLHEYLASGRPVVGTRIRTLEDFDGMVTLSSTSEEWLCAIEAALSPGANAPERRAGRQAVARKHDWESLVDRIATILAARLDRGPDRQPTEPHTGASDS